MYIILMNILVLHWNQKIWNWLCLELVIFHIRKAWVVVITYEDNYGDDIVKRYTEGKYSYFVDATTGEIIGGHTLDYIYSASRLWY